MTREISVKTNTSSEVFRKRIQADTLKDVAEAFPEVNFNATRVVIKNPRATLTSLSDKLPGSGDLFLFTFPTKNNSGQ